MRQTSKLRTLRRFLGLALGATGFYLWLISKAQAEHLVAAGLIGLAVASAVFTLGAKAGLRFEVEASWLALLAWRLPAKALRDVGLLAAALGRGLAGRRGATGALKELPFAAGGNDPKACARRALVLSGISLPPNTLALSVQPEKDSILVHQLVFRAETPTDKEWPL